MKFYTFSMRLALISFGLWSVSVLAQDASSMTTTTASAGSSTTSSASATCDIKTIQATTSITTTISSPAQATALQPNCGVLATSLEIGADASQDLDFTNLVAVLGDLRVLGANSPINMNFHNLNTIAGDFLITGAGSHMPTLSMDALTTVYNVSWRDWASNSGAVLTLPPGREIVVANATEVLNTTLATLSIIAQNSDIIKITDNPDLTNIALSGRNVGNITITGNGLRFKANVSSPAVNMTAFISTLGNFTLENAAYLSVGSWTNAASITIHNTTTSSIYFDELNLAGEINITSNPELTALEFSRVAVIRSNVTIANNDKLGNLNAFQYTTAFEAGVTFSGPIDAVELGDAKIIEGHMAISSSHNLDCPDASATTSTMFPGAQVEHLVATNGSFICQASNSSSKYPANASFETDPDVTDGSMPAQSGLSKGAQAGIGVAIALACLGLIGAVLFFLYRRRQRRHKFAAVKQEETHHDDPASYNHGKAELDSYGTEMKFGELPAEREVGELGGVRRAPDAELDPDNQVDKPELDSTAALGQRTETYEMPGDDHWRLPAHSPEQDTQWPLTTDRPHDHNNASNTPL